MINCRPVLLNGTIENVHENVIFKNKNHDQLTHKNITQRIFPKLHQISVYRLNFYIVQA